jgi:hypothetical protein
MSPLDELPPDLRATLSLLVDRGKSYAQVADLLGIPETVVRDRAHTALDALAGGPHVGGSDAPGSGSPGMGAPPREAPPREAIPQKTPAPPDDPHPGVSRTPPSLPVSRRGGAILLAGIVVVVVVVVLALTGSGGSSSHNTGQSTAGSISTATSTAGTSSTATSTAGASSSAGHTPTGASKKTSTSGKNPQITKQITLTPSEPSSKSIGLVEVLTEGTQHAFYIAAEHLPPSNGFFYVVWLYDSPTKAEAISKAPTVKSDGRLQGGALLPTNASEYHKILLTHETNERATTPGPVVLSGPFSLG